MNNYSVLEHIRGQKNYSGFVFCFQVAIGDTGAMRVSNAQVSPLHDRLAATGDRASATQVSIDSYSTNVIYIYGAPSKARNLTSYTYGRDFLLGILLLETCISLIYA
jgi:hypothetical protein